MLINVEGGAGRGRAVCVDLLSTTNFDFWVPEYDISHTVRVRV